MKMTITVIWALLLASSPVQSEDVKRTAYAVPPMDAPRLAHIGQWDIGTTQNKITIADHVVITEDGVRKADRTISARIWYPALTDAGTKRTEFTHKLPRPDGNGTDFTVASIAVANAQPVETGKFPLIIVSHGYNGWDSFMTWLTENLASKGYIVVAIDHGDVRATDAASLAISFGNVLINRAIDQRAVIEYYLSHAGSGTDAVSQLIDTDNVGIVGYSMGGFGALATAGMDYDLDSNIFSQLPSEGRQAIDESQKSGRMIANRIKAVVALAPFGGRPDTRAWKAETIALFRTPAFIIGGDRDDIVGSDNSITWIFDQMSSNRRHYLLFQNARHNIGGNPPPQEARDDFSTWEYFAEPVWRTERINAINQHFITAFLDANLKSDISKAAYLNTPTVDAADGNWPLASGINIGGKYAGNEEAEYWLGFQRRWSLGLEMRRGGYEK